MSTPPCPKAVFGRQVDKDETEEWMTMFSWKKELKGNLLSKGPGKAKGRIT